MTDRFKFSFAALSLAVSLLVPRGAAAPPIEIAEVKHEGDVDFEKEVLPILRRNCLACHSATEPQGELVLESPKTILKGGAEGPAVVPGKSSDSRLLKLASKQDDPYMPPEDNDVKAKPLTPAELGLIKLWIDQGAKGEVKGASAAITWQPLPPGINPIYATAVTADGQYAAASRANQIFLYHVPSRRELGRLTDPSLVASGLYKQPGVADVDLVQSLRFSPDGTVLASGGFRTVKLWKKPAAAKLVELDSPAIAGAAMAVSPSGELAAVADQNGSVRLFDLSSGKLGKTLTGHSEQVTGIAFTTDNKTLVTGSKDKKLRLWSIADGTQLAKIDSPTTISALALVAESKQVATAGGDNVIRVWRLPASEAEGTGNPAHELIGHTGPVTTLAEVGPAGAQLASGSQDGTVHIWDVATAKAVKSLKHGAAVEALAASPDGSRIVSVGSGPVAKLWDVAKGELVADLKGDLPSTLNVSHLTRVAALAKKHIELAKKDLEEASNRKKAEEDNQKKSAEALTKAETDLKPKAEAAKKATDEKTAADKAVAEASAAKTKADEAKKMAEGLLAKARDALKAVQAAQASVAKIDSDEAQTAKAAADKAVAELDALNKLLEPTKQSAEAAVKDAAAKADAADKKLKEAMASYQKAIDEQTAAQRTLDSGKRAVERAAEAVKKATEAIPAMEALVKKAEEEAKAHDAELTKATAAGKESEKPLHAGVFAADGSWLATAGDDGRVHTWDSATGAAIDVFSPGKGSLQALAAAPGGKLITAIANQKPTVWQANSDWQLIRTIGRPDGESPFVDRVTALDFSPDGKLLAVGGGEPSRSGEIKLITLADGKGSATIKEPHSDTVNCLVFSPDGKQLASGAADRFVKLWNVADGKFIRSFEGHTHHVLGVAWRADGRALASSGADMVLKLWDTRSGEQIRTVQNQFTKEVTSVTFLADGDLLVASGGDAKVRVINSANGSNQRDLAGPAEYMYSTATSADGKTIVGGGLDSVVRIWSDEGKELAKFAAPPQPKDQTAAK